MLPFMDPDDMAYLFLQAAADIQTNVDERSEVVLAVGARRRKRGGHLGRAPVDAMRPDAIPPLHPGSLPEWVEPSQETEAALPDLVSLQRAHPIYSEYMRYLDLGENRRSCSA